MTQAVIYCRISRDPEGDALGVERQRQDCLNYAARNDWSVVDTYIDNDISGDKDATDRKEFGRLVAAIRTGKIDAVVAYSQARLARDTSLFLEFCEMCKAAGVEQIGLVTDTAVNPGGSLFVATIIAAKDAEERRRIGELVKRKKLELAERGLPSGGGGRAFGYNQRKRMGDGWVVVPDPNAQPDSVYEPEAEMIRAAAEKVLKGSTLASIRDEWRASGVPPVGGGVWATKSVRNTLIRPRYCGLREHHKVVIGEAVWPAILERKTWERVVAVLSNPERRNAPSNASYPLKGLLLCGECGNPMPAMPRGHTRMYGCRKSLGGSRCGRVQVTAERIENYVIPLLRTLADSSKVRELLLSENEANASELRALVADRAEHLANLRRIGNDYGDGKIDAETHGRQSKRIQKRIDPLEARIAAIEGDSVLGRLGPDLEKAWTGMSVGQHLSVMRMLVSHIKVNRQLKGGNRFDPSRVAFAWRSGELAEAVGLKGDGSLDRARLNEVASNTEVHQMLKHQTDLYSDLLKAVVKETAPDVGTNRKLYMDGDVVVGTEFSSDDPDHPGWVIIEQDYVKVTPDGPVIHLAPHDNT